MRPIAFASRTLQKHEKNYGITELEGLGVVWAVKHFWPYIDGHHCVLYTDNETLKSLHSNRLESWPDGVLHSRRWTLRPATEQENKILTPMLS